MNLIKTEDITYLVQQPAKNISLILSGMTSLMNDTDAKVEMFQSQGWFKRMINTITGKNKITQQEIRQNHDKLNMYMSQAIAELYNKNCIDDRIILSLGTQINAIYADHIQLKQMLGAFVGKLNEKIDSVDNFHMLNTEIEQGVYSYNTPIITICMVISQFDNRMLEEQRKLDIIKRSLEKQNIFSTGEETLIQYLRDIIDIPVEEAGQVYLELSTIRNNSYIASIFLKMMEKYYFLSDMEMKMKNKQLIINELIRQENIDETVTLSIDEIYDNFVQNKVDIKNGIVAIDRNHNMTQMGIDALEEENYEEARKYLEIAAEQGDVTAQVQLGDCYSALCFMDLTREDCIEENREWSLEEDERRAYEWYMKAAEQDYPYAQCMVGECYYYGRSVKQSYKQAYEWYMKAAEQDDPDAQYMVGECYYYGRSVKQSYKQAYEWYMKAAEQDDPDAQFKVGECYYYGMSVEQNYRQAYKWYTKAAEQGHKNAQEKLKVVLKKI